ncbi:Ger(x)C family spore germination protein [Paenibacillus periandrae]|uniref:Ger(x)C family spore germination protein n=1 Tax=Paenibacillus periandrae TaxID=1761741 RepID=UPI001F08A2BE|nr:Ger(x)C family spore germination protein [Paenibacillus periandrae]
MRSLFIALCLSICAITLSACWNQLELTDWGFVQAAAIDQTEGGQIRLTSQIYKPGGSSTPSMESTRGASFVDIISENPTVFGASRDATNNLGRKLQWSHMRVLLISEEIAAHRNIGDLLDFFTRSHEPRGTTAIMITHGPSSSYLSMRPLIESTIGQQLKSIEQLAQDQSGKTMEVTLTDLSVLANGPSTTTVIPYVNKSNDTQELAKVTGMAIINFPKGTMSGFIPSHKTPYLLMLMNKYKGGFLNLPCKKSVDDDFESSDSFQISKLHTQIKPSVKDQELFLNIILDVEGNVGELSCSQILTEKDINRFTARVEQLLKKQLSDMLLLLQKEKADIIGIGTMLHRWHRELWKKWEPDWQQHFADSTFSIEAHVQLMNSGVNAGKPFTTNKK